MRCTSLFAAWILLSISSVVAGEAKTPDVRSVIVARTQAWCGPSMSGGLYPTNELHQGDRVQVMQELDSGWLAILPPAGSFSWINQRYVQPITDKYPNNYVVSHEGDPIPVLVGSSEVKVKPTKIGVKVERGTQVRYLGVSLRDSEGTWLRIAAPEGELRYVRKEDVSKRSATVAQTASLRKSAKESPLALDGDALWRDADKAERTGRLTDAIRLYQQAGDANLSVNPARAEEAYRRANWLQQANAGTQPTDGSYFAPNRSASARPVPSNRAGGNAVRLIGGANAGAVNGQLVSARTGGGYDTYSSGHLSRATRSVGNQRSYLLLNARHDPILYVVASAGVDLSSHVDRNVEVWGYKEYNSKNRAWVLTVTHVRETQ